MSKQIVIALLLSVSLVFFALGFFLGNSSSDQNETSGTEQEVQWWTCSMDPQIKREKPGKCPICFMDLIPLKAGGESLGPRQLKLSESAMKLAEIQTQVVKRREAHVKVSMVGKVAVDTTRFSDISILSSAELRRLFVNFSGVSVKKGDHLAELYSPEVYAAGQDYLIALKSLEKDSELIESAKLKLKLMGVPNSYIETIQKVKKVPETYTLTSSSDGFVEKLIGHQGMWIKKGQLLCRIVNMDYLWVHLDAYESDLPWIRYGQKVSIRAQALPGKVFEGTVSYIPPRVDDVTRTVKVRINVENKKADLKPGMFVSAELDAKVTAKGEAMPPELKGKWISPMHPEIVKDGPGDCDVCGMKLVKAESLGLDFAQDKTLPLLIPRSAALVTGKRAIVYVRLKGKEPIFEGKVVELGPKAGGEYVVLSGLKEGELIVTHGNFKLDSALQIQAKPSMMSLDLNEITKQTKAADGLILNNDLRESLEEFMDHYLKIREKLSKDDIEGLKEITGDMLDELEYVDYSSLKENELKLWNQFQESLEKNLKLLNTAKDEKSFREQFKLVSNDIIKVVRHAGAPGKPLFLMYCAMADGFWLQGDDKLSNPYYGSKMLRCGKVKESLPVQPKQP